MYVDLRIIHSKAEVFSSEVGGESHAMSYLKMNVLHLYFNDLCQFSVESTQYPKLTSGLEQYYTQQDVKNLLQYTRDGGIRIIPEIDVP